MLHKTRFPSSGSIRYKSVQETSLPLTRILEGEEVISSLNFSVIPWSIDQIFNWNLAMNAIMCVSLFVCLLALRDMWLYPEVMCRHRSFYCVKVCSPCCLGASEEWLWDLQSVQMELRYWYVFYRLSPHYRE